MFSLARSELPTPFGILNNGNAQQCGENVDLVQSHQGWVLRLPVFPAPTLTSPTPASAAVDCFKGVTARNTSSPYLQPQESRDAIQYSLPPTARKQRCDPILLTSNRKKAEMRSNTANDMPADAHASTCPGILAPLSCARLMQPPNPLPHPSTEEIGGR